MLKPLLRKLLPNPLDHLLKKAHLRGDRRILLFWNRGLGDIPLGLFAIVHQIRAFIPKAEITFLTRPNLRDGFTLLGGVEILVAESLKRGDEVDIPSLLQEVGKDPGDYDLILEKPNPTHWVSWQHGKLTPLLHWQEEWDSLWKDYPLDDSETYIGAHVQTETNYAQWRDWPASHWEALFEKINARGEKVILFGFEKTPTFSSPNLVDLRGETPLFPLLSIIKNRCRALVVPDSGISSMAYFLNTSFPLKHITLWADPYMGILKQNVPSPNPELTHIPLIGKDKDIRNVRPEDVYASLY